MGTSLSPQKKKILFCVILFVALCVFTTDMLDLREELQILSCPFGCPDNDFTPGIYGAASVKYSQIPDLFSGFKVESLKISFIHLLPYNFRAPPIHS
jgi:hypothetical protein